MVQHIALILDIVLLAFAFGATIWFFLVQTPALLKGMSKERFVPLQMRLTRVLFKCLAVVIPLMFATTLVHGQDMLWQNVLTAGLAMLGVLTNAYIAVPRALRAGGQALRETRGTDDSTTVSEFTSRGAGDASKVWHRVVVALVVVMLGGLVSHGLVLVHTHTSLCQHGSTHEVHDTHHAHTHEAVDPPAKSEKFAADAKTNAHIKTMKHTVHGALESGDTETVGARLRETYTQIFLDCTMDGDAHDRLHHYLMPIGGQIDTLEEGSPAERTNALKTLEKHLGEFEVHFR